MGAWWNTRSPREQMLLMVAGGLTGLLLLFQLVYKPVTDFRNGAKADYEAAEAMLADIASGAREAQTLKAAAGKRAASTGSGDTVRTLVTTSARSHQIRLTRLEPEAGGGLTVWIDEADATALQTWLVALYDEHGVSVAKASLRQNTGGGEGGGVQAQIKFAGTNGA